MSWWKHLRRFFLTFLPADRITIVWLDADVKEPCSAQYWEPGFGPCLGGNCVHNRSSE